MMLRLAFRLDLVNPLVDLTPNTFPACATIGLLLFVGFGGDDDICRGDLNQLRAFCFRAVLVTSLNAFEPDVADGRIGPR